MRSGYRVIDMDTHVGPPLELLEERVDPDFRARLRELDRYKRTNAGSDGVVLTRISTGAIPFDRTPGTAPKPQDTQPVAGGRGPLEGRTVLLHRAPFRRGVESMDADARIQDMDVEGRDIDFIFPGTWAQSLTALKDVTLAEGLYRAYHRYMADYSHKNPGRLKSCILVPGNDVEWAIRETQSVSRQPWAAAVSVYLPAGTPIDHPDLEPVWATLNELNLPLVHHGVFLEPPYFPGYQDIWGNAVVARTASHPWGASRFCSYLILSGIFDRYPNFRAAVCEAGHGWLPAWIYRLEFMLSYIRGTVSQLKYRPSDYVRQGRFRCAAEPWEGPEITRSCIELLGENCLMHQSDYPHGQCYFPESAQMVIDWPIWSKFGPDALAKHMYGNAAEFLRLS